MLQESGTRMQSIKRFNFVRREDVSGVSGVGLVGEGVEFTNGKVVMCWRSSISSLSFFDNIKELELVHGHEGRATIEWIDK